MATRENEGRRKTESPRELQCCSAYVAVCETVKLRSFTDLVELSVFCHDLLYFCRLSISAMVFTVM